ncbi:MAG TPA: hypothetical protein VGL66_03705 [Caulobacteraceae bacterium]|jgi:hypothetical protein
MKRVIVAALAAGLAVGGVVLQAHASACNTPKTVNIQFHRGATCWAYSGTAEVFVGKFKAGQRLMISAVGAEQDMGSNGRLVTRQSARDIDVSLKGSNQSLSLNNGQMITPATGTYEFTLFPCAVWGLPAQVQICASAE